MTTSNSRWNVIDEKGDIVPCKSRKEMRELAKELELKTHEVKPSSGIPPVGMGTDAELLKASKPQRPFVDTPTSAPRSC